VTNTEFQVIFDDFVLGKGDSGKSLQRDFLLLLESESLSLRNCQQGPLLFFILFPRGFLGPNDNEMLVRAATCLL